MKSPPNNITPHHPQSICIIGAGFIGSAIAEAAVRRGLRVRVLSRSEPRFLSAQEACEVQVIRGDARDPGAIAAALEGIDQIVYAAGHLMPGPSNVDPITDVQTSLLPLITVLEACPKRLTGGFTFLSSGGTVYGRARALPIPEEHPTEPLSSYGIMKLAGEHYVRLYATRYGFDARIVRCANAFGEGQPVNRAQGAVAVFLDRIARREPITMFGDGSVIRDFIHVADIAEAILRLGGAPPVPAIVNVGSGVGTSLRALVDLMEHVTGRFVEVVYERERPFDAPRNVLDVTRMRELIGLEPQTLEQGLRRTWGYISGES